MRWIYLALIILFAAATIVFVFQNFEIVTMSFLGFTARVPLALLRRSYEGSRRSVVGSP